MGFDYKMKNLEIRGDLYDIWGIGARICVFKKEQNCSSGERTKKGLLWNYQSDRAELRFTPFLPAQKNPLGQGPGHGHFTK
jgi:hypothetical protein